MPAPGSQEADIGLSRRRQPPPIEEQALLGRLGERSDSFFMIRRERIEGLEEMAPSIASSLRHSVVIDIPEETPHGTIAAALAGKPFAAAAGPDTREQGRLLAEQRELEREYVEWAAGVLRARQAAFGNGTGYVLGGNMQAPLKDALLPAAYDGVHQFISSASRSPVRNAVAAAIGPRADANGRNIGDLDFQLDANAISGAIGGVSAYAVEAWVLQAMSRRKKLSNYPELKPVNLKVLVPDPSPVQLRIVDGAKEYWRPDRPTMQDLKNLAADLRDTIEKRQQHLDGKGIFSWTQPAATGALNVARRALSGAAWLTKPLPVFAGSVVASASAGALTKFGFGMAKAMPGFAQLEVDDLLGGKQLANLYAVKLPQADMRPADWSDIKGLPRFVGDTAREAGALIVHSFDLKNRTPRKVMEQAMHVLTNAISNAGASILSAGFGSAFGSLERHGSLTPLPGEPLDSKAYLVQQFAQSATNDFYWNGGKEMHKSEAHALGTDLDRYREKKQEALSGAVHHAQARLPGLLDNLRLVSGGGSDAGHMPGITNTLDEVAALVRLDESVALDRLEQARQLIETGPAQTAEDGSAELEARRNLLDGLDAAIRLAGQHDELMRWRQPVGAEPRQ